MKIRVEYTEYDFSQAASVWSRIGGTLKAFAFWLILLFIYIIDSIFETTWPDSNLIAVAVVLAIVLVIGLIVLCSRWEKKCVERDRPKQPQFSELTDEQKHALIAKMILASSKNSVPDSVGQANMNKSVPPSMWTCSCGRVNANYVTGCTCGKSKYSQ